MKILHVVGARPNFVKIAPLIAEMKKARPKFEQRLIHTGQHYDHNMSSLFFKDLRIPRPNVHLNVGSGTHAEQTARIMLAFEPVVIKEAPDWVVVVGDVNSTLACSLVCTKLGVRIAHVEAGLRSGDQSMPEEINRIVTDHLADLLFTPSVDANRNLRQEGIPAEKVFFVGNIMIDTLVEILPKVEKSRILGQLDLSPQGYILVTLHRPSNVDDRARLDEILKALKLLSHRWDVVFPMHPRTQQRIRGWGLSRGLDGVKVIDPAGYLDFLALMKSAALVITDSGGVQEETTYLGIPCLTIRSNTERPITIEQGTNRLVQGKRHVIVKAAHEMIASHRKSQCKIKYWDGQTSKRIVSVFQNL